MEVIERISERLTALQSCRKMWEHNGGADFRGSVLELFSFGLVDNICDIYLNPSTTSHERTQIRALTLHDQGNILERLHGAMWRAVEQIGSTGDDKWLKRGLAAASIEDLQLDYRDTYIVLGDLYLAAAGLGIEPKPYFRQVAELSSEGSEHPHASMTTRRFLADFDKSAYFLSSVKPKLESAR